MNSPDGTALNGLTISHEHIEAINRPRRIIFQDDVLANDVFRTDEVGTERLDKIIDFYMSRLDEQPNQIDSIWFEWGEGNTAVWPSEADTLHGKRLSEMVGSRYRSGGGALDRSKEARSRGFLFVPNQRIGQRRPVRSTPSVRSAGSAKSGTPRLANLQMAPLLEFFLHRGTRFEAERRAGSSGDVRLRWYPDRFRTHPGTVHGGAMAASHDILTDFMRDIRTTLLDIGEKRGRPLLMAARVPEDLMGCHFDGMDVEAWVRDFLVDILVVGTRTANADVAAFRRITMDTPIKLYPSFDDHHSTDGYREPDLEVWRGTCANWWRQNPDGMHTFNLMVSSPQSAQNLGINPYSRWETQRKIFSEIGSPETLKEKDKVFFVERRGGDTLNMSSHRRRTGTLQGTCISRPICGQPCLQRWRRTVGRTRCSP